MLLLLQVLVLLLFLVFPRTLIVVELANGMYSAVVLVPIWLQDWMC